ncbi:MAG TPA: SMC family ATPase [Gemmataceae bacterium]|nr:SMC family ATPase [Gemmataceae bacterium]
MIPLRISLKGFLCYKDEQEITFDSNATLWMLSGLNGSGKSSIFDAVTYALFGHHRGGSQHAVELINKDSDGLSVEFDFRLENQDYRVRRTLRRTARGSPSSTQQIYSYEANGKKNWVAVAGSNYKREFESWIGEKIGLTYETFTSSVLLLQGKAEKLLGSKPEERRAVLASIVDLERYERLHDKTDAKRKELKGKLDGLSDRLAALPEVKPEQIATAEEAIRVAEEARQQASAEVDRLRELEVQARAWMDLQDKLSRARQRWQHAGQLLEKAADIERGIERLRELREVLPRLTEIANCRMEIHNTQTRIEGLNKEHRKAEESLAERAIALEQARSKRESMRKMLDSETAKHQTAREQLLEAKLHLDRLVQHELREAELAEVRDALTRLPADPERDVTQAREKRDRLMEIQRLEPLLKRFGHQREELRKAMEGEAAAQRKLEEITARGNKHKAEMEKLTPLVEEAKQRLQHASDGAAEARTLVKQARDSFAEANQLEGATVCRVCAQKLPPGHIEEEKRKRGELLRQAQAQEEQAKESLRQAQEQERKLRNDRAKAEEDRTEARVDYGHAQSQLKQIKQDIERLRGECARGYGELPQEHQGKIGVPLPADWLTTIYPTTADLQALRSKVGQLPEAQAHLQKTEDVRNEWTKLQAKAAANLDQLHRLAKELPADHRAVRTAYARLELDVKSHEKTIETHKANLKTVEKDIDRLVREREQADGQLRNCQTQMRNQELTRDHAQNSMQKQMKALPANWQAQAQEVGLTQVHHWESEKTDLEKSRIDEIGRELQEARVNRDIFRQEVEAIETKQQAFSAESRRDPIGIKAELERSRGTENLREKDLSAARQQLGVLENYRNQREQIGADYIRLEGELSLYKTLAELLGKNRLQLYLVRQAEKEVVEYANIVLDRLSGGQLYLKLRGEADGEGGSDRALDLEAFNRVTGEKPINVAFLSGSQKFRVAVSLALGIGQYASRQHRPIESVIIDEGFGCLDSQGRQVMIQELQNLRSQMRCILLVSHQEDFAEAFSDGYHFELEAGATRIKRFQK